MRRIQDELRQIRQGVFFGPAYRMASKFGGILFFLVLAIGVGESLMAWMNPTQRLLAEGGLQPRRMVRVRPAKPVPPAVEPLSVSNPDTSLRTPTAPRSFSTKHAPVAASDVERNDPGVHQHPRSDVRAKTDPGRTKAKTPQTTAPKRRPAQPLPQPEPVKIAKPAPPIPADEKTSSPLRQASPNHSSNEIPPQKTDASRNSAKEPEVAPRLSETRVVPWALQVASAHTFALPASTQPKSVLVSLNGKPSTAPSNGLKETAVTKAGDGKVSAGTSGSVNGVSKEATSERFVMVASRVKVSQRPSMTTRSKTREYRPREGRMLENGAHRLRSVNPDHLLSAVASSARMVALMRNVWETFRLSRYVVEDEVMRWDPKREAVEFEPIIAAPGSEVPGRLRSGGGLRAVATIRGRIQGSLYKSVLRVGGDAALAVSLANIFSWEVDFRSDLRPGDRFWILADGRLRPGHKPRWKRVLGVMLETGGRPHRAIAFPDHRGRLGYYDEAGQPLHKLFLGSPVNYTRISSGYSRRRFHPILKIHRPHRGIDFAAPFGTPVRAVASGVVVRATWTGQGGKTVELRHPRRYSTKYHHLSRYGRGIRRGKRVVRGDIIGYVGSTGLSTGPHLDFRVLYDGRPVNPLRLKQIAGAPISKKNWKRFARLRDAIFAYVRGPIWKAETDRDVKMVMATSAGR